MDLNEPDDEKLKENFLRTHVRCLFCGEDGYLGKEEPRVRNSTLQEKLDDKVDVCNQFILKDNPNSLGEKRRFLITCISCNNCGGKFCLTMFDYRSSIKTTENHHDF